MSLKCVSFLDYSIIFKVERQVTFLLGFRSLINYLVGIRKRGNPCQSIFGWQQLCLQDISQMLSSIHQLKCGLFQNSKKLTCLSRNTLPHKKTQDEKQQIIGIHIIEATLVDRLPDDVSWDDSLFLYLEKVEF